MTDSHVIPAETHSLLSGGGIEIQMPADIGRHHSGGRYQVNRKRELIYSHNLSSEYSS